MTPEEALEDANIIVAAHRAEAGKEHTLSTLDSLISRLTRCLAQHIHTMRTYEQKARHAEAALLLCGEYLGLRSADDGESYYFKREGRALSVDEVIKRIPKLVSEAAQARDAAEGRLLAGRPDAGTAQEQCCAGLSELVDALCVLELNREAGTPYAAYADARQKALVRAQYVLAAAKNTPV